MKRGTKFMRMCVAWKGTVSRGLQLLSDRRGFGMNELLGIAAALIIAAFIVIPSLRAFAQSLMSGLGDWWEDTIASRIFPTA